MKLEDEAGFSGRAARSAGKSWALRVRSKSMRREAAGNAEKAHVATRSADGCPRRLISVSALKAWLKYFNGGGEIDEVLLNCG